MVVIFTFCLLVYLRWRIRIIKEKQQSEHNNKKFRAALRVLMYPLAFTIMWIFPMINRFNEDINSPVFALATLQAIFESSFGLASALVYLITMRKTFWYLFRHRKKPEYVGDEISDVTLDHVELKDNKTRWKENRHKYEQSLPEPAGAYPYNNESMKDFMLKGDKERRKSESKSNRWSVFAKEWLLSSSQRQAENN